MEDNITYTKKEKSLFNGLIRTIHKLVPKKKTKKADDSNISRFKDFLLEIDRSDPMYETAEKVAELCEEAITIAKQRLQIIDRIQSLDTQMSELKCYENLEDEEVDRLRILLDRFLALNDDKNVLRFQMTSFDKGLVEMENLEEDARFSVPYIEEAEKSQRILRRDLGYLHGEKSDLEYQNEMLRTGQDFIHRLSALIVVFFGLIAVVLFYLSIFKDVPIFYPLSFLCILMMIIITSVHMLRNKIKAELRLNILKQHRAVQLINKKNVVYVYYTSFLNFVYKKYNVKSVAKLKKNIKDYGNYKHLTTRFDSIRNNMYETEDEIETFLREKNIVNNAVTTEKFAKTANIEDKKSYYQDIAKERERLDKRLSDLDGLHENIWKDLVVINEADSSPGRLIDRIIQRYLTEVGRLVSINKPVNETEGDEPDMPSTFIIPTVGELIEKNDGLDKTGSLGYNS